MASAVLCGDCITSYISTPLPIPPKNMDTFIRSSSHNMRAWAPIIQDLSARRNAKSKSFRWSFILTTLTAHSLRRRRRRRRRDSSFTVGALVVPTLLLAMVMQHLTAHDAPPSSTTAVPFKRRRNCAHRFCAQSPSSSSEHLTADAFALIVVRYLIYVYVSPI